MLLLTLTSAALLSSASSASAQESALMPAFKMQEIDATLGVGYAVLLVDVDHDAKRDIVVVDQARVIWYANPTWKMHTIIQGGTKPDNVCIDAHDIDGDGKLDFALGADWKPFNTASGGTLQWLKRGKTLDEPWSIHPIDMEPTVHRIRFADVDGDGKSELISVPSWAREARPRKTGKTAPPCASPPIAFPPIRSRIAGREILDHGLRVIHNFYPVSAAQRKGFDVLIASYEGVHLLTPTDGKWSRLQLGAGNQENQKGKRGASEIKQGSSRAANASSPPSSHGMATRSSSTPNRPNQETVDTPRHRR